MFLHEKLHCLFLFLYVTNKHTKQAQNTSAKKLVLPIHLAVTEKCCMIQIYAPQNDPFFGGKMRMNHSIIKFWGVPGSPHFCERQSHLFHPVFVTCLVYLEFWNVCD